MFTRQLKYKKSVFSNTDFFTEHNFVFSYMRMVTNYLDL